jgi:Tol biopolymer transport system component
MKIALVLVLVAASVVARTGAAGSSARLLVVSTDHTGWSNDHGFAYASGARLRPLALGSAATASPDGRLVAFVRDGALWTVVGDGSGARRVATLDAELSFGSDPVWSADDRRLAVPLVDRTDLVDVATGTVGSLDTVAAAFSPDGARVAYVDRVGLEVADASGANAHVVAPGWEEAGSAAWSFDGRWIAFVGLGENGVPRVALARPDGSDVRTYSPGGVGFPGALAWSRDGRLAWVSSPRLQVTTPGGPVRTVSTVSAVDYPEPAPAWSSDGRLLAVRVRGNVIALVPAGGGPVRLVDPPAPADALGGGVSWLGKQLVLTAHKRRSDLELALVRADGTGFRELTRNGVGDLDPAWSPDGRDIAFARLGSARHGLYAVDPAGRTVRRLTNGDDRAPAFSPDGLEIAFGRGSSIRLFDLKSGKSKFLVTTHIRPRQLSWTKDGGSIFFGDDYVLKRVDVATGSVQTIDVGDAFRPVVSPDGTRLAFLGFRDPNSFRDPAAWGIFLSSPDGTNVRRISSNDKSGPTSWSPDGTLLVAGDGSRLELVDVASRERVPLLAAGRSASAAFRP